MAQSSLPGHAHCTSQVLPGDSHNVVAKSADAADWLEKSLSPCRKRLPPPRGIAAASDSATTETPFPENLTTGTHHISEMLLPLNFVFSGNPPQLSCDIVLVYEFFFEKLLL
ncbi:hypothetical protein Tco_0852207 [Tanacetum coccineum]